MEVVPKELLHIILDLVYSDLNYSLEYQIVLCSVSREWYRIVRKVFKPLKYGFNSRIGVLPANLLSYLTTRYPALTNRDNKEDMIEVAIRMDKPESFKYLIKGSLDFIGGNLELASRAVEYSAGCLQIMLNSGCHEPLRVYTDVFRTCNVKSAEVLSKYRLEKSWVNIDNVMGSDEDLATCLRLLRNNLQFHIGMIKLLVEDEHEIYPLTFDYILSIVYPTSLKSEIQELATNAFVRCRLEYVKSLTKYGYREHDILVDAAHNNNIEMIKFLIDNGYEWDVEISAVLAINSSSYLSTAISLGCPWSDEKFLFCIQELEEADTQVILSDETITYLRDTVHVPYEMLLDVSISRYRMYVELRNDNRYDLYYGVGIGELLGFAMSIGRADLFDHVKSLQQRVSIYFHVVYVSDNELFGYLESMENWIRVSKRFIDKLHFSNITPERFPKSWMWLTSRFQE